MGRKANVIVLILTILSLVLLALAGCRENEGQSPEANQSLLFFQTISQGSYKNGVLSLEEVLPQVFDYNYGNYRLTGYLTATRFVELWNQDGDIYKANPPRARLFTAGNEAINVVMELSSPTANDWILNFNVKILSGDLPARLGPANLFIDAIPAPAKKEGLSAGQSTVVGDAPAMAMGTIYQSTAQALANAAHNASNAQPQGVTPLYLTDASGKPLYIPVSP